MAEGRRRKKDLAGMHQLIAELLSLVGSKETVRRLLPYGAAAIAALMFYLLEGEPQSVYQPRQQAVLALAALGARDALMEYLRSPRDIKDPVLRGAEELVESTAARELGRWRDEKTFRFLAELMAKRFLTGGLEALGEFKRIEVAPLFVKALEDDFYRPAAEKGLRELGNAVRLHLVRAATVPTLRDGWEFPSSVRRRHAALRLLANTDLSRQHWLMLRPLLADEHIEIVAGIGTVAAMIAPEKDRVVAKRQIVLAYPRADWQMAMELEAALKRLERGTPH